MLRDIAARGGSVAARAPLAATSSGTIIRSGSPLSRALPHLRALGKPLLMIGTSAAAVVGSVVLDPADNLVSQKDEETMLKQAKETGKKFNPEEQNKK